MSDLEQQSVESIEKEDIEHVDIEEETTTLVTFRLGNGEYAIDIMQAKEIIKMEKITLMRRILLKVL